MRFLIATLITCCFTLALTAQQSQNQIAYYVADSILPFMPLHKEHQDSLAMYRKGVERQLQNIKNMGTTTACGNPIDTTKDTPLVKSLRQKQRAQIDSAYLEYKQVSDDEYHIIDSTFRAEEIAVIQESAEMVAKQQGYPKIYEKKEAVAILRASKEAMLSRDVTGLVLDEMELK